MVSRIEGSRTISPKQVWPVFRGRLVKSKDTVQEFAKPRETWSWGSEKRRPGTKSSPSSCMADPTGSTWKRDHSSFFVSVFHSQGRRPIRSQAQLAPWKQELRCGPWLWCYWCTWYSASRLSRHQKLQAADKQKQAFYETSSQGPPCFLNAMENSSARQLGLP